MTKKQEAAKTFVLCLKENMTDNKLNNIIIRLLENVEIERSDLSDKYSTPYGVKVSKAVEKKNSKLYDEAEKELYKTFAKHPKVQEFMQKVSTTCGDSYKKFRSEFLKEINRDIANLKKYLSEPNNNVESKEFLEYRLKGAENKKSFYKMDPKHYVNLTNEQGYEMFAMCSKIARVLNST
jgi:hypothetical protein